MNKKKRIQGILFVISGPSGVGKTTLVKKLLNRIPSLRYSVSCTTRPPRAGEKNEKDYFFLTEERFMSLVKRSQLLEWAKVHEHYYGTPGQFIEKTLLRGYDALLDIDIRGAVACRKLYKEKAVLIFIAPPRSSTLKKRLARRAQDTRRDIRERLRTAKKEMRHLRYYKYCVINDTVPGSLKTLISIIRAERARIRA